jgi:threonine/homoserine/homoserine lactone efflux protein
MPDASLPVVFITSLFVGFSGALSPGPLLVLDIRESMRLGFRAGPLISLGHALLELLVVVCLYLGLSNYFRGGVAIALIGFLGGVFLLWMSWGLLRQPSRGAPSEMMITGTKGAPRFGPIVNGALVSLANPFWTLWWATLGVTYLVWAQELGIVGLVAFYVGHILADFSWYSLVSFGIASGRKIMGDMAYRLIMLLCGLFLLILGIYFLISGVRFLFE